MASQPAVTERQSGAGFASLLAVVRNRGRMLRFPCVSRWNPDRRALTSGVSQAPSMRVKPRQPWFELSRRCLEASLTVGNLFRSCMNSHKKSIAGWTRKGGHIVLVLPTARCTLQHDLCRSRWDINSCAPRMIAIISRGHDLVEFARQGSIFRLSLRMSPCNLQPA